jgi:hypothetical protein
VDGSLTSMLDATKRSKAWCFYRVVMLEAFDEDRLDVLYVVFLDLGM